jgi:hypothetical protein
MADWLYTLPEVWIFILGLVASILLMYLMSFLLKKTSILNEISDHEKEFLIAIQSGLVALSAIVLSFSLVVVVTNYDHVDTNVSSEASRINDVDRLLHQYGDANLMEIRKNLKKYAESIVKDEWPKLMEKQESEQTSHLFQVVSDGIAKINPNSMRELAIYSELIRKADELIEFRENRLESAHLGLHNIFWIVNLVILFSVIFMSALGLILNKLLTAIGISLEIVALVGLMSIVFVCDQPFKGTVSVNADTISASIKTIEARQK